MPETQARARAQNTSLLQEPSDDAVAALAASIDVRSPLSIAQFGKDVGAKTAHYADALLSKARSGDLDEAGARLNEIILSTQAFDLASLDGTWSRTPIIGRLLRQGAAMKEKAMAKFASVKTQVDKVAADIDATANRLMARAQDFDAMYEGVKEEHASLTLHVRAAERRLAHLEKEFADLASEPQNTATLEVGQAMEASRQALGKRVADLSMLAHSSLQTLPMIRVMQGNNLLLIDKFQTIQRLTLPAWKRSFTLALALDEQRNAAQLANDIDDATNLFMRRNAELLHENAVATAKTNQRLVIDIDTLRHVHDTLIQTFVDVRTVHAEGEKSRAEALEDLSRLRDEMVRGLSHEPQPQPLAR
ncbi:toxic anion resistance protein [Caulobacter sp. LARHSG274]